MKRLQIFTICFLSLLPQVINLNACGGYWEYEDLSIFAPEFATHKNSEYFRELYSSIKLGETHHREHFNISNTQYWRSFFNESLAIKDIDSILYSYSLLQIDQLIFEIKGKPKNKHSKNNGIKENSNTSKALSLLYYVGFAKRCEGVNKRAYSWWDKEGDNVLNANQIEKLIKGGLKNVLNNPYPIIRERYYMQLTRLHFALTFHKKYRSNTTKLNAYEFFKQNQSQYSANSVSFNRANSYAAGALQREGKISESNLIYAQLHQLEQFKNIAQLSYSLQNSTQFTETLALANSKKDKIALWKLQGLEFNSLLALQEIYKLNPKAEELNLFLTRIVNIFEEDLNFDLPKSSRPIDSVNNFDYQTRNYSIKEASRVFKIIHQIANNNNTAKPFAWHAAAGYMASILQENKIAKEHLNLAESSAPKNTLVREQLRLLRIIQLMESITTFTPEHKRVLAIELSWLLDNNKHPQELRYQAARRYVKRKLSYLHSKNNEPYLAQFTSDYFNAQFYNSHSHLNGLIKQLNENNTWTRFIKKYYSFSEEDLKLTKGILYFYQEETDSAAKYFLNSKLNDNNKTSDIVFKTFTKDCIYCGNEPVMDRVEFIEEVQKIKKQIANGLNLSKNYFELANAYYNTSYFGNHRYFANMVWLGNLELSFYYPNKWMERPEFYEYMQNDVALKYFLLAAENSTNDEFKAKCYFRAAKCEQNNWIVNHGEDAPYNAPKSYFKLIKNNYSQTKYFQEILKECGYFKSYLNEQK